MAKKEVIQMNDIKKFYQIIDRMLEENPHTIIGIDGNSGAGKSTLAFELRDRYGADLVHMDDFYLTPTLRTPEREAEPGGNFDRVRYEHEVASKLQTLQPFEYGVYDCEIDKITRFRHLENKGLVVVEGAYTLYPEFRDLYDLKVFMAIDPKLQLERITSRNGAEEAVEYKEKWIPMENFYHETFGTKEIVDVILNVTE